MGAFCVLVLSTLWGGETVVEKNIRKFEVSSLEVMDLTGLSLLGNGWHELLPTKCAAHGAKRGPCGLGF